MGKEDFQTLVPGIAEAIRDRILSAELGPGEHLRQQALAAALEVSAVPLREALRRLEGEGLVTFEPFRGAVVTPVTVEEIQETQDMAMALELSLLERALPRLGPDDFRQLRALAEDLDRHPRGPAEVVAFYRTLFGPAGRPQMLAAVERLIWRTCRFFPLMQLVRCDFRLVRPTRMELLEAIESGEVERAKDVFHTFHQVRTDALVEALRGRRE